MHAPTTPYGAFASAAEGMRIACSSLPRSTSNHPTPIFDTPVSNNRGAESTRVPRPILSCGSGVRVHADVSTCSVPSEEIPNLVAKGLSTHGSRTRDILRRSAACVLRSRRAPLTPGVRTIYSIIWEVVGMNCGFPSPAARFLRR